jgi:hypothetical protein
MAKLGAAVASASLSQYPPSGDYTFAIRKFEYAVKESGSGNFEVVLEITESNDKPEVVGRKVYLNINVVKRDGEPNDVGGGDVRKIVAAVFGADASSDPDFDTDELVDQQFFAKLSITEKDGQENARLSKHAAV